MKRRFSILMAVLIAGLLLAPIVGVAVAQEDGTTTSTPNSTPTSTPTSTPNSTPTPADDDGGASGESSSDDGSGGASESGGEDANNAEIVVRQPSHIDSPATKKQGESGTIHVVNGATQRIILQNVSHENVVDSGVSEEAGSLTYDSVADEYILETSGTSGTYTVYWTVADGDTQTTYQAQVKVVQAQYVSVTQSEYDELKQLSQFGQDVLLALDDYADGTEEALTLLEEEIIPWYEFYLKPWVALTGQFFTLMVMLFTWPAGLALMATVTIVVFWFYRKTLRDNVRYRRQMGEVGDLNLARAEQWVKRRKQFLSEQEYEDFGFSHTWSQFLRENLGSNPWRGISTLADTLDDVKIMRAILDAHAQLGYNIDVSGDGPTVTEAPEGDGVVDPREIDESTIQALDWTDFDARAVREDGVDVDDIELPIKAQAEDGDLIDKLDIRLAEDGDSYYHIENREQVAECLAELVSSVASTEYCDEDGVVREEMDVLELLWVISQQSTETHSLPLHTLQHLLLRTKEELDPASSLSNRADELSSGGSQ